MLVIQLITYFIFLTFSSIATEVDASAGEKRKSIVDADVPLSISPKKARVEGEEAVVEDLVVPTNGTHETVA